MKYLQWWQIYFLNQSTFSFFFLTFWRQLCFAEHDAIRINTKITTEKSEMDDILCPNSFRTRCCMQSSTASFVDQSGTRAWVYCRGFVTGDDVPCDHILKHSSYIQIFTNQIALSYNCIKSNANISKPSWNPGLLTCPEKHLKFINPPWSICARFTFFSKRFGTKLEVTMGIYWLFGTFFFFFLS